MALPPLTPRDRLEGLLDLARKTLRYWWLVAGFAVIGGGLSVGLAMTRPRQFQSSATVFLQERIQSSLFQGREEGGSRSAADRYRELLLARGLLAAITTDPDPKINAFLAEKNPEAAIDKLRLRVRFEGRGANAFRISYTDSDPDRAKTVTDKLTSLLRDKDEALRNDQAQATVTFATNQKDQATAELRAREKALAEFLAGHPEFAQETGPAEGASIRAINSAKGPATVAAPVAGGVGALERQRTRLLALLNAPPTAPRTEPAPPSPERLAAEAAVAEAEREVAAAQRRLDDAGARFTDKHPTVVTAREAVEKARDRVRAAKAAVPPDAPRVVAPASAADREKLAAELKNVEYELALARRADQGSAGAPAPAPAVEPATNRVVQLETEYADLRRGLNEQRERVSTLASTVFRAQLDANQKLAEQGGRLSVVDPAFRPARPSGPGKSLLVLGGTVLFVAIGAALALGLALIDDRLYRRGDIDSLGLVPVLAVIPSAAPAARRRRRQAP